MKMKRISLLTVLFVLLLALSACAIHEHTWVDASCTAPKTCSECGATEGEALPHAEEIITGSAATCEEAGLTDGKKCSVCGEVTLAQEIIPATGHDYKVKETVNSTCTAAGKKVYECSCGDSYEEALELASHTPASAVEEGRVDSTCTVAGYYYSVVYCSVCETHEISRTKVDLDLASHTPASAIEEGRVASTCTVAGYYYSVVYCSVCKTHEISRTKVDLALASHTPGAAATCTTPQKCTVCTNDIVAAKGHTWDSGVTENETTTYTCNDCGVSKAESDNFNIVNNIFTDKEFIGTDEANAQVLVATWFSGGGYEVLTDGKKTEEQVGRFSTLMNNTTVFMDATIDLGEAFVLNTIRFYLYDTQYANAKEASIGKDMLIQVYIDGEWYDVVNCEDNASLCEYLTITDGYNNDCLEFNLGGIVAEKIRFYISGAVTASGITYQEIECSGAFLNFHTHTEEALEGIPATCLQSGLTAGVWCPVCKEILDEQEVIPAKGHTWDSGVTSDGITTYSCTACGLVKTESESFTTVDNLFDGKQFVPSSDASGNAYNSSFGYQTITDGIIYQEGSGRYSSKSNGGKVEASIDLGAAYVLSEFKIYLHEDGLSKFGTGLVIEVLIGENWVPVIVCETPEDLEEYWVDNPDSTTMDWLVFDLDGATTSSVKFTIPGQTSTGWTTFYEIECSGSKLNADEPELIDNVFANKTFTPTEEALASVLTASWWKGSGYEGLTDGIKNADNATGRFATVMATTGMMDATIDLGGSYELHSLKFYTYDPTAGTTAGSLGADLLIQVYANGQWADVINCANNESIAGYLVVNSGTYNDYLEFNLNGVTAEKVRFYISASASTSGTSFEEIECTGYAK